MGKDSYLGFLLPASKRDSANRVLTLLPLLPRLVLAALSIRRLSTLQGHRSNDNDQALMATATAAGESRYWHTSPLDCILLMSG